MTPTLEELEREEDRLILSRFDYETAWQLGAALQAEAARRHLPVAIEVCHGETMIFFAMMPGATPDNPDWTRRKRAVALRFHRSSLHMRLVCEQHGWEFSHRFRLPESDFAASGGVFRSGCARWAWWVPLRSVACPTPKTMRWWQRPWRRSAVSKETSHDDGTALVQARGHAAQ